MHHKVIAIDGPAASGKSSVSRQVAKRLGFIYVNTGAMYRAVAWQALRLAVDPSDASAIEQLLATSSLECGVEDAQSSFRVDGIDPGEELVGPEVNACVSKVAAQPAVRRKLVELQRGYATRYPSVMEGRDIGTAVFPETPHKFYVDASAEVRAARRAGQGLTDSVQQRDSMDSSRKDSPLMIAANAEVIDTSHMNVGEVVDEILRRLALQGISPSV